MSEENPNNATAPRSVDQQQACSPFVERRNYLGREYLRIGGVVVAMEGDICHDFEMDGRCWTEVVLDEAAARITAAMKANDQVSNGQADRNQHSKD